MQKESAILKNTIQDVDILHNYEIEVYIPKQHGFSSRVILSPLKSYNRRGTSHHWHNTWHPWLGEYRNEYFQSPGPCITNVFATHRKNFSQWYRNFQRKLLSHWLKFLRHVAITLVIQGPATVMEGAVTSFRHNLSMFSCNMRQCHRHATILHVCQRCG